MPSIRSIQKKILQETAPDRDILLAHVIKKPKEFLYTHPEYSVPFFTYITFLYYLRMRRNGYPVAYCTGNKEFFGLDFCVTKNTLVPRPETEIIVEEAVKKIQENHNSKIVLIDAGTGSGCIPVSILKKIRPQTVAAFATDISKKALRVAKRNALLHSVAINFLHGSLLEPIVHRNWSHTTLIITANLPYITKEQFAKEKSIRHEPRQALVAKDGGLALYKAMLGHVKLLMQNASPIFVFMEIDPSQSARLTRFVHSLLPTASMSIIKDLAGYDRVVCVAIK